MPSDISWRRDWDEAVASYERGQLAVSVSKCRQVLAVQPRLAPALHLMGLATCQLGEPENAVRILKQAVDVSSNDPDLWNNLGNVQRMLRQHSEAMNSFLQAIRLDARHPEATNNLGFTLYETEQYERAIEQLQRAIQISPEMALPRNNLACAMLELRRVDEAIAVLQETIRLMPSEVAAYVNLGDAFRRAQRLPEAEKVLRQALAIAPKNIQALINLAGVFKDDRRFEDALPLYAQALQISPDDPSVLTNLGDALRRLGRWQEAENVLRRAIQLAPQLRTAMLNLAGVYKDLERDDEAFVLYERALQLKHEYAEAHWDFSLLLLAQGNLRRGWEEYEWRIQADARTPAVPKQTLVWRGDRLDGQTLLVVAEQGLGDAIQWIRFIALAKKRGAKKIIVAAQKSMLAILSTCSDIDLVVDRDRELPPHDCHCLLGSLPRFFSPDLSSVPAEVPYLHVPERLIQKWKVALESIPGVRIGIGWQGNPRFDFDRFRSAPLRCFESIARLPGVTLISLQQGVGLEQLPEARKRFSILELPADRDSMEGAFMDTAAIIRNLDLVVSSDTSLVHLAGAIGAPIWMPLGKVADWRWLRKRTDSPWYPTMRIFRQSHAASWDDVFAELASSLRESSFLAR